MSQHQNMIFRFYKQRKKYLSINVATDALTLLKSSETKALQQSISEFTKKVHVQNNIL